jgi:predicted ATP-grasp superfamily ATP-dependent carboligase
MEINPRFWGSMQVAINAGVDFPQLLYRILKEGDTERSLSYKTGIRCRYVLFNDLFRLIKLLRSDSPLAGKRKAIGDFLRFQDDHGYYVYSRDDLVPLFGLAAIKLLKKLDILKKNLSFE